MIDRIIARRDGLIAAMLASFACLLESSSAITQIDGEVNKDPIGAPLTPNCVNASLHVTWLTSANGTVFLGRQGSKPPLGHQLEGSLAMTPELKYQWSPASVNDFRPFILSPNLHPLRMS